MQLMSSASGTIEGDLLICGHAGYISLLALEVVAALAPEAAAEREAWLNAARGVVLQANVGEVCAFEVGPSGATYHLNPEATDFGAAKTNDAFVTGSAGSGVS